MKDQIVKKVNRRDGGVPQTIQQLIRKYSLDTMWENIQAGTINADRIKTGIINADLIKTGTINADLIKTGVINASLISAGILNADLIKAGTMSADRIKGGTLILGGENDTNGSMQVKDAEGNNLVSIGKEGLKLENGTQLISEEGILSVIQFGQNNWKKVGYNANPSNNVMEKMTYDIPVFIPEGYTIMDARVVLMHSPIKWSGYGKNGWGYCKNLRLYKNEQAENWYEEIILDSEGFTEEEYYTNEIEKAFGEGGFSPTVPGETNHNVEMTISKNIKDFLSIDKSMTLQIHSGNEPPEFNIDLGDLYSSECFNNTGNCIAILTVIGFYKGGNA